MAIDQALLDEVERTPRPRAYLRLYRWDPPCLSFGRNEPAALRYDRAAIEREAIDVVRRPTGGRAVWHEHEVTYAVVAPLATFGCLQDAYRAIHRRLAGALQTLGLPADLAPATRAGGLNTGACFARPVGGEVLLDGRKVIGSAQLQQGSAFLQHGSILLDGSQDVVDRVSLRPGPPARATTLSAALGRRVTFAEVVDAIRSTWQEPLTPTALPPYHLDAADPAWTWRR